MSDSLPELHQSVWNRLQCHVGRKNGIRFADLATLCDLPERQLRKAVAELVTDYRCQIGSDPKFGYFICDDDLDFQIARRCLWHHIKPTLDRDRVLEELQNEHIQQAWMRRPAKQANLFEMAGV
ncbi:MAG: hypothetical protein HOC74_10225 [Gemmatimonadetes bacterium]|jgi:hypothetical protein|nr:hypothetical protein [Gemmatimonadota bacterium]